jgi:hypothetical protein
VVFDSAQAASSYQLPALKLACPKPDSFHPLQALALFWVQRASMGKEGLEITFFTALRTSVSQPAPQLNECDLIGGDCPVQEQP